MSDDVAIFLDLDNLVIGAKQAHLEFDINLVLDHLKKVTEGRIVLRHAYGAGKQSQTLLQELAQAGFVVQSATRINAFSKNLADMQIVVNAMDTLIDGHQYGTYVLLSGDRDFTPLVQSLRKRGKRVVGVGLRHTTSKSLVELCDEYIYYEELLPRSGLTPGETEALLIQARDDLLSQNKRVRASVLKQRMMDLSRGAFDNTAYPESSFRKFLEQSPHIIQVQQEDSTLYIHQPQRQPEPETSLHERYRTALKKQRLRVVEAKPRFRVLNDTIERLRQRDDICWRDLLNELATQYRQESGETISKNMINAVLLLAREAQVIRTLKGRSLSTAPVLLSINGPRAFQEAVVRCDATYLENILNLHEAFDIEEAALALYESKSYTSYLQQVANRIDDFKAR